MVCGPATNQCTWTSQMAKIMDPVLPILSILGCWAIIWSSFGGPGRKKPLLRNPQYITGSQLRAFPKAEVSCRLIPYQLLGYSNLMAKGREGQNSLPEREKVWYGPTRRDLKTISNFCYLQSQEGAEIIISTGVSDPLKPTST